MDDSSNIVWEIWKPVTTPLVRAGISQAYSFTKPDEIPQEIQSNTIVNSELAVRENSLLILMCVAAYSVAWFKDGREVKEQVQFKQSTSFSPNNVPWTSWADKDNTFVDNIVPSPSSTGGVKDGNKYWITGYQSSLKFDSTKVTDGGEYVCKEATSRYKVLQTTIHLAVTPVQKNLQNPPKPQLLQAGFSKVGTPYDLEPPVFEVIYALPANSVPLEYVILPKRQRLEADDKVIRGLSLSGESLSETLRRITLRFPVRPRDVFYDGDYKFMVDPLGENGGGANGSSGYVLQTFNYKYQKCEGTPVKQGRLVKNRLYEFHAYHSNFAPVDKVSLEVFDTNGTKRLIPPNLIKEKCGILGAARVYDENFGPKFGRVQFVVDPVNACSLKMIMSSDSDTIQPGIIHLKIAPEFPSQGLGGEGLPGDELTNAPNTPQATTAGPIAPKSSSAPQKILTLPMPSPPTTAGMETTPPVPSSSDAATKPNPDVDIEG